MVRAVDAPREFDALGKLTQSLHLDIADDLVSDKDVVEPCIGHDFRFPELCNGNSLAAAITLNQRDCRSFMGLGVRTQSDSLAICAILHGANVVHHNLTIHKKRRSIEFADFHVFQPLSLC